MTKTTSRRVYLLDVEGTVAPISLVDEQLFPYARRHFDRFLEMSRRRCGGARRSRAAGRGESRGDCAGASRDYRRVEHPEEVETHRFRLDAFVYLNWLMDRDRKSTALKSLQGKIWKTGFERGELKGTLFADVPEAFARWSKTAKVAIYSSGSVEAQQLLFHYSTYGDLTPLSPVTSTHELARSRRASYACHRGGLRLRSGRGALLLRCGARAGCRARCRLATRLVIREGNAAGRGRAWTRIRPLQYF